jgi:hypothetical protein
MLMHLAEGKNKESNEDGDKTEGEREINEGTK